MSDLHPLPLVGHDAPFVKPVVRAKVMRKGRSWYWSYDVADGNESITSALTHGPFRDWEEAFASAYRMVEAL